jgi:hypothetical protein
MILNFYALLAGSLDLLRLPIGGLVAALAWGTWRRWRASPSAEQRTALEDRLHLLSLLAVFLFGLNLVSWPLLYLVLQSYVPEWPGVMCVYGVTRIGLGSEGASRALPVLLQWLQVLKPALVFLLGAGLVLYRAHQVSRTAALLGRILGLLLLVGIASSADAAAETAYLVIPKKHEDLAAGCCTVSEEPGAAAPQEGRVAAAQRPVVAGAFFALGLGLVLALARSATGAATGRRLPRLGPLLLLAGAVIPLGATFLTEVLAPAVLGLPFHRCAYDLIPGAPEILVGVGLFAWGSLCAGWAAVARYLAWTPESAAALPLLVRGFLRQSAYGTFYALVLASSALWVAR